MRLFGRKSPPAACLLRLVPAHDVTVDADGMRSTGNDPVFLLQPETGSFPQGRCEFVFEALPGTIPLQPVLYLDTGADFNEAQMIRLAGGAAGFYRQLITLPPDLARLRFDPTSLPGPLPLQNARLVPRPGPVQAQDASGSYAEWIQHFDTLSVEDERQITRHIAGLPSRPRFTVWISVQGDVEPAKFTRTVGSLKRQLYSHWRGRLSDGGRIPGLHYWRWRPAEKPSDYVLLLQPGDVLAPHALYRLAAELAAHPETAVLTLDDDRLDPMTGMRRSPRFRAAWSPDLMRGGGEIGVALVRQEAIAAAGGLTIGQPGTVHDLLLRLSDRLPRHAFRHVPGVLVHRTEALEHPIPSVLASDLQRRGIAGHISGESVLRVHYPLPDPPPLVSVIIPTRDGAAMLRQTIDGVMHRTDYPALEVIVLDNGSEDAATLTYLEELAADPLVRILPTPGPFNYAQLNNAGVEAARGEIVVLLNNDMNIIGPDWLAEMVSHAVRPEVGAVGCKLLYADGTVQHAGIVTGMRGLAGHGFRGQDGASPGYLDLLCCTRNVSAVTGACLVMRRELYLTIGGLDAENLPVSYNDVDLCLRLDKAGYLIVWTPFASLYHLESVTRGADSRPENAERAQREHDVLLQRWGERLLRDPYYSPCLTIDDETYDLAWPPRMAEPWRMVEDS